MDRSNKFLIKGQFGPGTARKCPDNSDGGSSDRPRLLQFPVHPSQQRLPKQKLSKATKMNEELYAKIKGLSKFGLNFHHIFTFERTSKKEPFVAKKS